MEDQDYAIVGNSKTQEIDHFKSLLDIVRGQRDAAKEELKNLRASPQPEQKTFQLGETVLYRHTEHLLNEKGVSYPHTVTFTGEVVATDNAGNSCLAVHLFPRSPLWVPNKYLKPESLASFLNPPEISPSADVDPFIKAADKRISKDIIKNCTNLDVPLAESMPGGRPE
jgi:hypothetical protein